MANKNYPKTITLPKWIKEISPQPEKYLKGLFKIIAFFKMKEYQKQKLRLEERYLALPSSMMETLLLLAVITKKPD